MLTPIVGDGEWKLHFLYTRFEDVNSLLLKKQKFPFCQAHKTCSMGFLKVTAVIFTHFTGRSLQSCVPISQTMRKTAI